jgi:DNA processing protein
MNDHQLPAAEDFSSGFIIYRPPSPDTGERSAIVVTRAVAADDREKLLTLCALTTAANEKIDWSLLARTAQTHTALDGWYAGRIPETSRQAERARRILDQVLNDPAARQRAHDRVGAQLAAAADAGAELTTVLDADYPANLRLVPDAPPFLFHRGPLLRQDARSIAVVGTRRASPAGLSRAARMARGLSDAGITVVSGLARGIDTSAHVATLGNRGRTIAVIGTGIAAATYPAENAALVDDIVAGGGAVVSQFWPTDTPDKWRFPARNITMSGLSQGTVVIEASSTSGAKMQAQAALRHAKTVFLLRSLATEQPWAAAMLERARNGTTGAEQLELGADPAPARPSLPSVVEVTDVADVLNRIADETAIVAVANLRHELADAFPVTA